jgi:3-carboxy-cis,cis-muconate cycloisomerase
VSTVLSARPHAHERAAGAWHTEWRPLNDLLRTTGSAAAWLRDSLGHLRVDTDRMRANLELTRGLTQAERVVTALTGAVGRLTAHDLVSSASQRALDEHRALADVLEEIADVTTHLDRNQLRELLDPATATGNAAQLVDRALAHHAAQDTPRDPP